MAFDQQVITVLLRAATASWHDMDSYTRALSSIPVDSGDTIPQRNVAWDTMHHRVRKKGQTLVALPFHHRSRDPWSPVLCLEVTQLKVISFSEVDYEGLCRG